MERILKRETRTHTTHSACVTCHRTIDPSSTNAPPFAGNIDPSSTCLDCHHYEVNHHPVGVVPNSEYLKRSGASLPLFNGQVRCLTCHQAHSDPAQKELSEPLKLLRGGHYTDRIFFCFKCHSQEDSKINPHRMLTSDGTIREVNNEPVCLMCHTKKPDPAGDPEDVEFKADVAFLCWRCHSTLVGSFMDKHFHVKPKWVTQIALKRTEKELGIILPLAIDGMVTCSTCHNPHQQGVLTRRPALAGVDEPRMLRIAKNAICSVCHAH